MITHVKIRAPFDHVDGQTFYVTPELKEKIFILGATLVLDHNNFCMITPEGEVVRTKWTVVEVISDRPTGYNDRKMVRDIVGGLIAVSSIGRASWGQISIKFFEGLVFFNEEEVV